MRRIRRVWRRSEHLLAAATALVVAACGTTTSRLGTQDPTPTPSEPLPAESPGAESPAASPSLSESPPAASPTPARSSPPPASPQPASPQPTEPTAERSPTPSPTDTPTVHVVPGRPLRHRRRLLTPDVTTAPDVPRHPDHERLGALPARLRQELHRRWLDAARMEHGSVPAFAEVAVLLAAVGAPLELVAAAHAAALDEIEHTRISYALANAYGRTRHAPGALPRLLGRRTGSRRFGARRALRALAVDALRDGCLAEGFAAAVAAEGAATAVDPAPRAALLRIAADEAAHAELSWRVLGWCLAADGPRVRRAVERALSGLPTAPRPPAEAKDVTLEDYAVHGFLDRLALTAVYREVRMAVHERAQGLLVLSRS